MHRNTEPETDLGILIGASEGLRIVVGSLVRNPRRYNEWLRGCVGPDRSGRLQLEIPFGTADYCSRRVGKCPLEIASNVALVPICY
jgi:hypothetical protein